jgi:Arm DNA-binding domain
MRGIHRLTPLKVAKLKRVGLHADGGNLYLQISLGAENNVRRSWLFRYAEVGKTRLSSAGRPYQPSKSMGLGSADTIGLAEVREKARKYRAMLLDGVDPLDFRNAELARRLAEAAKVITFEQAMQSYLKQHEAAWTPDDRNKFVSSLRTYALPTLTARQLELYQRCTGRMTPPIEPTSEAWMVIGRRGGKSFVLALIAVFLASFRSYVEYLGPGERGTIAVIAQDRKSARTIMRYVLGLLKAVPMLKQTIEHVGKESVDLTNRLTIEIHTASFRTVRGYTVVAALCDELAFWRTEDDNANPRHRNSRGT